MGRVETRIITDDLEKDSDRARGAAASDNESHFLLSIKHVFFKKQLLKNEEDEVIILTNTIVIQRLKKVRTIKNNCTVHWQTNYYFCFCLFT